jgi:hypothetical protein
VAASNRALWATVSGMVREFSALDYPVLLGVNRILRRVEGAQNVTKPGARGTESVTKGLVGDRERITKPVAAGVRASWKPVTKPRILAASKGTAVRARTSAPVAPSLLDLARARARRGR